MFLVFMPLSVSGCPYETEEGGGAGGLYVAGGAKGANKPETKPACSEKPVHKM